MKVPQGRLEGCVECCKAKLEPTKHVEAEKPKIRASKPEYKLVDEVYVPCSVVTIFLISPVQMGRGYIQVHDRGFGCAARSGDGPRRVCLCCSRSNR